VAILTATRHGPVLLFVMTFIAGSSIAVVRSVCLVIKQDTSRCGFHHDPNGFFWGLLGKTCITNNPDDEQDYSKEEGKRLFTLRAHFDSYSFRLN
jgi:hypothetical protein